MSKGKQGNSTHIHFIGHSNHFRSADVGLSPPASCGPHLAAGFSEHEGTVHQKDGLRKLCQRLLYAIDFWMVHPQNLCILTQIPENSSEKQEGYTIINGFINLASILHQKAHPAEWACHASSLCARSFARAKKLRVANMINKYQNMHPKLQNHFLPETFATSQLQNKNSWCPIPFTFPKRISAPLQRGTFKRKFWTSWID